MAIMEIRPVGSHALLLEVDDVEAWRAAIAVGTLQADEIVPGARTILLDGLADPRATAAEIRAWPIPTTSTTKVKPRQIDIPIVYDGPDLDDVAALWHLTRSDAIATIAAIEFRVEFFGFAPGFAYLGGLPHHLAVPRHRTPRTKVPPGSVALADTYAGIYPNASPGGWRLIGHTDEVMFDVDRDPPALLGNGDRVRFVA
jgi:KipI family sensor histidine kinase inhibitor